MGARLICLMAAGLLAMTPAAVYADNVTGTDRILCTAAHATICDSAGDCESGPPWLWSIPQFLVIDLKGKNIASTKASGENRKTPIQYLTRVDGLIVLQGVEEERAFSFVIHEETGALSAAVARDEVTVSAFGACTPAQ